MASTTILAPFSEAGIVAGGLGAGAYAMAARVLIRLGETFDPLQAGMLAMVGTIGGNGSDTIRVPDQALDGAGVAMTALSGETAVITPSTKAMGYTDFTLGSYGIGYEDTYMEQMLALPQVAAALSIEQIMGRAPGNVVATLRSVLGTALATISASVGSSADAMSLDTYIAARNAFNLLFLNEAMGPPCMALHPAQLNDLQASIRTEPWFQHNGDFGAAQGLMNSQFFPNAFGLGFDLVRTNAITQSGSAYQGAAYDRGAVGVVFGDTARISPNVPQWMAVPGLGLLVQMLVDGARQAKRGFEARAFLGVGLGSTNVFRSTRVLSAV